MQRGREERRANFPRSGATQLGLQAGHEGELYRVEREAKCKYARVDTAKNDGQRGRERRD